MSSKKNDNGRINADPSTTGDSGRDKAGKFLAGNTAGKGNPFARRVAQLRALIVEEVSDDDLRAIVRKLIEQAKAGDMAAAREIFTRAIGKAPEPDNGMDPDRIANADAKADAADALARRLRDGTATPQERAAHLRDRQQAALGGEV
jgi:hypothetical protein